MADGELYLRMRCVDNPGHGASAPVSTLIQSGIPKTFDGFSIAGVRQREREQEREQE
jgi:hypothetical protein